MSLRFVSAREPLCDPRTGIITRTWYLLFQALFTGNGIDDGAIDTIGPAPAAVGVETRTLVDLLRDEIAFAPVYPAPVAFPDDLSPPVVPLFYSVDDVLPAIGALRDEIASLRREIDDLRKGQIL